MSQTLTEYEGSKAGSVHKIIRGNDGVVYCDCWAWKINKKCKHLDRFFGSIPQQHAQVTLKSTGSGSIPVLPLSTAESIMEEIKKGQWDG